MPAYTTNYGCISTCGAAFPSIRSQESHILEIPDIAPLEKESLDLGLHYLKDKVADLTYLPQGASPLTHLVYYTTLTEQKSPYTLETHTTVQRSVHSNLYTKRWLQIGFVSALSAPFIAWGLSESNPYITTAALVSSTAVNVISWIATGSNPDFKSDSANALQDAEHEMAHSIQQAAAKLVELKFTGHESLAREIANSLDIHLMKELLDKPIKFHARSAINDFAAATDYVINERIQEVASLTLRNYIDNLELKERIQKLS